jgi:hypothetical protein
MPAPPFSRLLSGLHITVYLSLFFQLSQFDDRKRMEKFLKFANLFRELIQIKTAFYQHIK